MWGGGQGQQAKPARNRTIPAAWEHKAVVGSVSITNPNPCRRESLRTISNLDSGNIFSSVLICRCFDKSPFHHTTLELRHTSERLSKLEREKKTTTNKWNVKKWMKGKYIYFFPLIHNSTCERTDIITVNKHVHKYRLEIRDILWPPHTTMWNTMIGWTWCYIHLSEYELLIANSAHNSCTFTCTHLATIVNMRGE